MTKLYMMLRDILRFWGASFAHLPALSRDMSLPAARGAEQPRPSGESSPIRVTQLDVIWTRAEDVDVPEMASEMAWGAHLKLSSTPSVLRFRI